MTEEEKKALQEKEALLSDITVQVKSLIAESQKDNASKLEIEKAIAAINAQIEKLDNEQIKQLKETVDKQNKLIAQLEEASKAQGLEIAKGKNQTKQEKITFREAVKQAMLAHKDAILVHKNDDNGERLSLKDFFQKGNNWTPQIVVKDAVDMLQSNIIGNYAQYMRMTELDPMRVGIPLTIYPHVLDVFPSKQVNRANMSLLVVYSYTDGSGVKTEGSASGKSSFLLKTVEFKVFNISTHFKLSDETLDDLEETLDEISIVAPDKVLDQIDSKVFADAGDNSTDIRGLFVNGQNCTDFVAATYAASVKGANMVDLISKMALAVRKNKYRPNMVGLNATDIDNIQSLKDALDNSVSDRRLVFNADGTLVRIAGLRVIENDAITANTCVVGAVDKAQIGVRKAMTLEIGLDGTDFTEGQKTVRIGTRIAFGVRDKAAFSYSADMATDLATITVV